MSGGRLRDDRLPAADVLRVLAVGIVAWFHIWQQGWLDPSFRLFGHYVNLQAIVRRGYMMVDLMLLLSGFLLYLPVARRGVPVDPADFYRRRLRRILPSYLFCVLLLFGAELLRGGLNAALAGDLAAHLTFTHTFFRRTYMYSALNSVLWTLAVEMQFYFLFPYLSRLFSRRPWAVWGGMTALALLYRALVSGADDLSMYINQLPAMLDIYAFGMLAAYLLARQETAARRLWRRAGAGLLCLLGILAVLYFQNPADLHQLQLLQLRWRLPLAVLGGGFLLWSGKLPPGLGRALGNPVTRFLSGISYNFYIWHQYLAVKLKDWHIPAYLTEMPQRDEGLLWQRKYTALCFAAALAAAVLTTYLVEKPCARLLRRRKDRQAAPR